LTALTKEELKRRIRRGDLIVSPLLSSSQIGDISIDVRLGTVALMVRGSGLSYIDPREYLAGEKQEGQVQEKGRRQKFDRFDVPFNQPLLIQPGNLALVPTFEWFRLPTDLKGVVTARSSWAREGLSIATATFVEPGYTGIITLELANLGNVPIALFPGMRIAQIALYQLRTPRVMRRVGPTAGAEKKRQFQMSFEPRPGQITKDDEAFIPVIRRK
jgi:dCTP deaminase